MGPKLIVSGASAYSRHFDFERIRALCDRVNALFLFDMAHISGLVAGNAHPSPFPFADIVTTTTHKSLRGPRAAMLFYRRGVKGKDKKGNVTYYDLEARLRESVSSQHQRLPSLHSIAALSTALQQAQSESFRAYQRAVLANSQSLVSALQQRGFEIVSGGTDNHLALVDLRAHGVGGAQVERLCEVCNIALNKNTVPGDKSALSPGGCRVGSPAMTTRGCNEADFGEMAAFLSEAVRITKEIQSDVGTDKLKAFKAHIEEDESAKAKIEALREEVVAFARQFPLIGVDCLV